VITDGCLGVPNANLFEFLLTQLRTSTIACTFLRIGETRTPFGHFGHIPHTELMQFISTATFGSYFDTCPNVVSFYKVIYKLFICKHKTSLSPIMTLFLFLKNLFLSHVLWQFRFQTTSHFPYSQAVLFVFYFGIKLNNNDFVWKSKISLCLCFDTFMRNYFTLQCYFFQVINIAVNW
jgi:hypothetical protein